MMLKNECTCTCVIYNISIYQGNKNMVGMVVYLVPVLGSGKDDSVIWPSNFSFKNKNRKGFKVHPTRLNAWDVKLKKFADNWAIQL